MAGVKGRSGGARVGAGRKRRDPQAAWLAGASAKGPRGVVARRPVVPAGSAADVPACPPGTPADVAEVWRELAPYAVAERTLDVKTALAFLLLCRNIVLERKLAAAPLTCAGPDHRGMLMRVEQGLQRFRLLPDGRPVPAEAPADEWAEFDGLAAVPGGKAG